MAAPLFGRLSGAVSLLLLLRLQQRSLYQEWGTVVLCFAVARIVLLLCQLPLAAPVARNAVALAATEAERNENDR